MSDLFTASRLRVFRECPRKHDFRYRQGFTTAPTPAMLFGTEAHKALEAWYRAWQAGEDRIAAAMAVVDESDLDDIDRIRLRAIIAAYDARWGAEDWEGLGVEQAFSYRLCGGKLSGVQGSGKSSATSDGNCAACKGSGWRLDETGQPESPRLYANQRDRDETLDEFEERLTNEIAERVDEYLSRAVFVRLD